MTTQLAQTIDAQHLTSGDPKLFEALVRAYQSSLFGFVARMGFSAAEAEDLVQEVFMRVWTSRSRFDPRRARVNTWVWTIARNLALNRLEHNRHRPSADRGATGANVDAAITANAAAEPMAQLEVRQRLLRLDHAIAQLNAQDRLAISLVFVDELSMVDAAELCDCSVGAFRVRLSRARSRLLKLINHQEQVIHAT